VENKSRNGAPRKLTDRDTRGLIRLVRDNRRKSLNEITNVFNQVRTSSVSKRTVQRKLESEGYHRRVIRKRIRIRQANRKNQLAWCRTNRRKTVDSYWKRVIFSDECKVDIGLNHRVFVWRKVGESYLPCCLGTPPTLKISLMIWGCITYDGVGTLTVTQGNVNSQQYITILDNHLWPVICKHFPTGEFICQDDNAPIHRARAVSEYKFRNGIHSMLWPAQSPDINIIENLWYRLKRELKHLPRNLTSASELETAIRVIWNKTPVSYIKILYYTIPRRLQSVIKSRGYITKY